MRDDRITLGPERTIDSGPVDAMSPAMAGYILESLRRQRRPDHSAKIAAVVVFSITVAFLALGWLWVAGSVVVVGAIVVSRVHWSRRYRPFLMHYSLPEELRIPYDAMCVGASRVAGADRVWLVRAESGIVDGKYAGGAGVAVHRRRTRVGRAVPHGVESNLIPPVIGVGTQALYFFPDRVIVLEGLAVGAVEYPDLQVKLSLTTSVEHDEQPSDAHVVGSTWEYVNRDGGPDRRFAQNRQIPLLEYAEISLRSSSGLNERIHVSSVEAGGAFVDALRGLIAAHRARGCRS